MSFYSFFFLITFSLNFVFRVTLQRRFAIEILPLSIYVSVLFLLFSFFPPAILCAVEDHLFFFLSVSYKDVLTTTIEKKRRANIKTRCFFFPYTVSLPTNRLVVKSAALAKWGSIAFFSFGDNAVVSLFFCVCVPTWLVVFFFLFKCVCVCASALM